MYYAKLDQNNIVEQVIVADAEFVSKLEGTWVPAGDDGVITKNYPGIGHKFDQAENGFVHPKQFPSWVLKADKLGWEAPVPYPNEKKLTKYPDFDGIASYKWNDQAVKWELVDTEDNIYARWVNAGKPKVGR